MKLFLTATFAFFGLSSAAPSFPWVQMAPPPAGTTFYQLQAKSSSTTVANQWVTLKTGSTSYALASAQTAATKFFIRKYEATGTYAIHNADDTRQVVLLGPDGTLLYLVDVTNPTAGTIPSGQLMEWATFTNDSSVLGVKDGSTLQNRTFVAVEANGGYSLALYDGASSVKAKITPITLNFVKSS